MSSAIRTDQNDFVTRPVNYEPRYEYLRVSLMSPSIAEIQIASNATTGLEFKLPASRVVNFARSYIKYNYTAPGVAGKSINSCEDVSDFASSASLADSKNTELMRLENLQQYQKIIRKIDTSLDDMMTNDDRGSLFRSNKSASDNVLPAGGTASEEYIEPLYMQKTNAGAPLILNRQFMFNSLKGTILGVDRNFYCPSEMYLRFQTPRSDNVVWLQDSPVGVNAATSVSNLVMKNVTLFLAVETNDNTIKLLRDTCMAGALKYDIPYTVTNRQTGQPAGGETSFQVSYNNSQGHRLKRIVTTAMNPKESLDFAFDANNNDGVKISSYSTYLDNVRLQDRSVLCTVDDWNENRFLLGTGKNHSCILSRKMYYTNWFHMDSFAQIKGIDDLPEVNIYRGLDMAIPKQWQFSSYPAMSGLVHYTFAEFLRPILITPLGVELISYPLIVSTLQTRG